MDLDNLHDDWKQAAPNLAVLQGSNPYTVPEGYFAELEQKITSQCTIQPFLTDGGFSLPGNYFDELPSRIEAAIYADTLKQEITADGFAVPAGYFDTLERSVQNKIQPVSKHGKVRRLYQSWMSYAAAACITIATVAGIYFNYQQHSIEAQMAKIPEQEIINYLELHTDAGDITTIVNNIDPTADIFNSSEMISDQELSDYLEQTAL
ncbi:hypothetical protein FW774_19710 [Pedobacter sp. BS3]|uniref:hypothetical protein n=1 Tax=Pedobacter sp. BS3 TaxID=2567937 RepID=UPI0011F07ABC|nr:hypothetical protein [Pedobacter sp. BS3]TZF81073.1 hypothetical protein FW774_19710 [Pedobacter sp. BS3]